MDLSRHLRESGFASCSVSSQPLTVGTGQSPLNPQVQVLMSPGAEPFHPENPEALAFFSRVLVCEKQPFNVYAGSGTAVGRGLPTTPANVVLQNLPASCISLGPLKPRREVRTEVCKSELKS